MFAVGTLELLQLRHGAATAAPADNVNAPSASRQRCGQHAAHSS